MAIRRPLLLRRSRRLEERPRAIAVWEVIREEEEDDPVVAEVTAMFPKRFKVSPVNHRRHLVLRCHHHHLLMSWYHPHRPMEDIHRPVPTTMALLP